MTASLAWRKRVCPETDAHPQIRSMTAQEFENRIIAWAQRQSGLEALIQIGSRVQPGATVDGWSDWDYHFIVRDPARYRNTDWPAEIAPCWCSHYEKTGSGVVKLGAVFENGLEVDFVLLAAWQMKLVYWAMARPGLRRLYPPALINGVHNTQRVVGLGHQVIFGDPAWESRLTALKMPWLERTMISAADFVQASSAFWRHAVWLLKKIARGELRAAARWYTLEMFDHVYVLLAEEARLAGRGEGRQIRFGDIPARKAEQWLNAARLRQTEITTAPNQKIMAVALEAAIDLFQELSASVAKQRGFARPDCAAVEAWLRAELAKLPG